MMQEKSLYFRDYRRRARLKAVEANTFRQALIFFARMEGVGTHHRLTYEIYRRRQRFYALVKSIERHGVGGRFPKTLRAARSLKAGRLAKLMDVSIRDARKMVKFLRRLDPKDKRPLTKAQHKLIAENAAKAAARPVSLNYDPQPAPAGRADYEGLRRTITFLWKLKEPGAVEGVLTYQTADSLRQHLLRITENCLYEQEVVRSRLKNLANTPPHRLQICLPCDEEEAGRLLEMAQSLSKKEQGDGRENLNKVATKYWREQIETRANGLC